MKHNNYKEVKNYIHNDLKISKEDINNIIQITVSTEIRKLMKDKDFIEGLVANRLKEILSKDYNKPIYNNLFTLDNKIYDAVFNEISKTIKERLKIELIGDDENE